MSDVICNMMISHGCSMDEAMNLVFIAYMVFFASFSILINLAFDFGESVYVLVKRLVLKLCKKSA